MTLAKGRSRRSREAKKPKTGKKPIQPVPTFLHPQLAAAQPATKEGSKQHG
jgi:hypothetical protein